MEKAIPYLWLALCCAIVFAQIYYTYKIQLFAAFFISSTICFFVSVFNDKLHIQCILFTIWSFLSYMVMKIKNKRYGVGKKATQKKAIALCCIDSHSYGKVYYNGKSEIIENTSDEMIKKGEIVIFTDAK